MSDTPRTDAAVLEFNFDLGITKDFADFARQLERELNEADSRITAFQEEQARWIQTGMHALRQRDQWRECARRLAELERKWNSFQSTEMSEALQRFDELEKGGQPNEPKGMTVEEAKKKRICRICHGPDDAPFTYNYGKEYAHTKCLEMEKGGQ